MGIGSKIPDFIKRNVQKSLRDSGVDKDLFIWENLESKYAGGWEYAVNIKEKNGTRFFASILMMLILSVRSGQAYIRIVNTGVQYGLLLWPK